MKSSGNVVKTTLNTHSHSVWWTQNSFSHLSIGKIKKQAWLRFSCNKTKSHIFCFLFISTTFKTCFWYNFIRSNVIWFCTIWLKSRILQEVAVANNVTRPKIFGLVTSTFFMRSVYLSKWSKPKVINSLYYYNWWICTVYLLKSK